jgi:diguanylate cyclase (GGDEF)-like protein
MRTRLLVAASCAALLALFVVDLRIQPGGERVTRNVDDIAQLLAATFAAVLGLRRGVRSQGQARTSWLLIGLAAGCWAAGEAVWSYFEVIADVDTPFPSLADAGYLLFPAFAAAGLLVWPSRAFAGRGRTRVALDALLISVSLFALSWSTVLSEVYRAHGASQLATVVSLAYPTGDLVLLTVVTIVISYAHNNDRAGLAWIGAGLVAFAVADSGFAYLTTVGRYQTGNLIDACWVAGFLILGCGALRDTSHHEHDAPEQVTARTALLLPYLPAAAGTVAALWRLRNSPDDVLIMAAAGVIVLMLVVRQVVVQMDNRRLMVRIAHQARHDELTGLPNRALFMDRLTHALELHSRNLRGVTVLLLDLDDFKSVNDTLGHTAGDELLVSVGERLRASVRSADTVARLGGDEFALLIEDGGDPGEAAGRILANLEHPVRLNAGSLAIGASIGIATLEHHEAPVTTTELLARADIAMYGAKRQGKGGVRRYFAGLTDDGAGVDMPAALATDLAVGRLGVAFQPIQLADGNLYGFEALARWSYRGRAMPPAQFLPLARRLGKLPVLDHLVLRAALAAASGWADDLVVSVNVDGDTLADPTFVTRVRAMLHHAGVPARRLAIEVVETSLVDRDGPVLETLGELRAMGVRMAVDGFGYSYLIGLHNLQPDIVKIDRRLTDATERTSTTTALLSGITHLAHQIGALVIAQSIETPIQLANATDSGCDAVQGFLLGVPGDPAGCLDLLRRHELGDAAPHRATIAAAITDQDPMCPKCRTRHSAQYGALAP